MEKLEVEELGVEENEFVELVLVETDVLLDDAGIGETQFYP